MGTPALIADSAAPGGEGGRGQGACIRAVGVEGGRAIGIVHKEHTAERALARKLVTEVSTDPACLAGCELVILALPIPLLLDPDPSLVAALPASAVVTDVGSVKQPVLDVWSMLHPRFVASHPMAGTARQ